MEELKKDIKQIKEDVSDIKVDLRYHIKRTDLLEKEVAPVSKFVYSLKILGAAVTFLITLYGAYVGLS